MVWLLSMASWIRASRVRGVWFDVSRGVVWGVVL